jgi:ribosome maturation protein Sdo1
VGNPRICRARVEVTARCSGAKDKTKGQQRRVCIDRKKDCVVRIATQYINAMSALPLPPSSLRFLLSALVAAAFATGVQGQVVIEPPATIPVPKR